MEVNKVAIDDLNAELTITLQKEDYLPNYEKSLKNYAKQVSIPGFRPGKVPFGMVKKKYGPSILADELNKLIGEKLNNYIQEEKLEFLGQPLPKEDAEFTFNWDNPGDPFTVKYELGLAPEIEIPVSEKDSFDYLKVEVTEEMVQEQIANITRRYGKVSEVTEATDEAMVFVNLSELNESNDILEGGVSNSTIIRVEAIKNEETKAKFVGCKVSDSFDVNPINLSENIEDVKRFLGNPEAETFESVKEKAFRAVVTDIKTLQPADLNQELFDKALGKDVADTEEKFKEELKNRLQKGYDRDAEFVFKRELRDAVIEKLDFKLPDEFLKRWIKASNEKEISDEILEKEYPLYVKDLRWQLVENKLIKENELKVEADEVINHVMAIIASQYQQYGIPAPDENELKASAIKALENEKDRNSLYRDLFADKAISALAQKVKRKEKKIESEAFLEIANKR
jgi:trigger factor